MRPLGLIKKIGIYYSDLKRTEGQVPGSKTLAAIGAITAYVFWGTSFSEYFGYRFWRRTHQEKRAYMTRRYMFRFFDRYNPKELRSRIGDKSLATKYYSEFLQREQFNKSDGFDAFLSFTSRHPHLFVKKAIGWGGTGARKEKINSEDDAIRVWRSLNSDEVVEPVIENHDLLKKIYPDSLNTIKVTVLQTPKGPVIATAIIRFGNQTVVDNVHSGGIAAGINVATGEIETAAMDKHFREFTQHPITGEPILGIVVPEWEAIKKLAIRASLVTPQLRYTSWDIALTNDGPIMIEGNWDAEFYAEQALYNRGHRRLFTSMLEGLQ